jgi:hypothetical protein
MYFVFNSIDHLCSGLPVSARLGLYGLFTGVLAMLLYWLLSPRDRILGVKADIAQAQQALRAYKGTDPREILRLSGKSISAAIRQILLLLGPTLIATAPVLLVMAWLESTYNDRMPNAGDQITMTIHASGTAAPPAIQWVPFPAINQAPAPDHYRVTWPESGQTVEIVDSATNQRLLDLPLPLPLDAIGPRHWWSTMLEGGQSLHLPSNTKVSSIEFSLAPRRLWSVGPGWLGSWQTPFLLALSAAALGMKFALKIV